MQYYHIYKVISVVNKCLLQDIGEQFIYYVNSVYPLITKVMLMDSFKFENVKYNILLHKGMISNYCMKNILYFNVSIIYFYHLFVKNIIY